MASTGESQRPIPIQDRFVYAPCAPVETAEDAGDGSATGAAEPAVEALLDSLLA
jgi:hypothetical protein